jgi:signal recognition particle GTPase
VAETTKEIRKALLDADVNYKTAKDFTDRVKAKALGQNVLTSGEPGAAAHQDHARRAGRTDGRPDRGHQPEREPHGGADERPAGLG